MVDAWLKGNYFFNWFHSQKFWAHITFRLVDTVAFGASASDWLKWMMLLEMFLGFLFSVLSSNFCLLV
jgi:hypothetical protein